MKNQIFLFIMMIVLAFSCNKKVTEVEFSTGLSVTSDEISVNDTASRAISSGDFIAEFTLDLENDETREYLDKIENIDLENVRLSFQGLAGLAGNQTPTHLKISFDNEVIFEWNNFIWDNVAGGEEFLITQTDKIREVADILQHRKKVNIKVEGQIPDTDTYHFFITLMAQANITAKAL